MFLKKVVTSVIFTALAANAMANDRLPVGDCFIRLPEYKCAIFTIRPDYSMAYVMGDCQEDGQLINVRYRARHITRVDRDITIDHQYHIKVMTIAVGEPTLVSIRYKYPDDYNVTREGSAELSCY